MTEGKGAEWGKTAMRELMLIKYERRTGLIRENISSKTLDWGSNNESAAIQWVGEQFLNDVKSCADDFDEIVFNEPSEVEGFGDSPDFFLYDFDGNIDAVGEIKCPTDQAKIEELRSLTSIDEKQEYYWQFIGHFIGTPEAKRLLFVVYDAYANEGVIIEMQRDDHLGNIDKAINRIKLGNRYVNELLKLNSYGQSNQRQGV
jgi:hypothetical protein